MTFFPLTCGSFATLDLCFRDQAQIQCFTAFQFILEVQGDRSPYLIDY